MIYYGYSINSGADNMRIDSEILDRAIEQKSKEPVFRLYGWSPKCISLGRNQKDTFLTGEIDSVRRLTGGRALLHDNEVTYSYVAPIKEGQSLVESYKDRLKNPYYTQTDKKATIVTYYNINKAKSTLDEGLKIEYSRLGKDSPLRFNRIHNFFIYGLERISTQLESGDFGIVASDIEGEAIILPNTI